MTAPAVKSTPAPALLLGLDVGTSGAKGVLVSVAGDVLAERVSHYEPSRPHPGWSQQDPLDWWNAVVEVIRSILQQTGTPPSHIIAIGLSGQMHGSVLLGAEARNSSGRSDPLCPALLWNDQRTDVQCRKIKERFGSVAAILEHVGNAPLPGFTLPKLLWMQEHEPSLWAQVAHLLMPKDFIAYRLTGTIATDVGDASGTLLFDVAHRRWSSAFSHEFGINPDILPSVFESADVVGLITPSAGLSTGLLPGTPVIIGSGDNQAAAVGAGAVEPGVAVAVLGTSGVILAPSDSPRLDLGNPGSAPPAPAGRLHTMCAAAGHDAWCMTGCTLSAGFSLSWARQTIAPDLTLEQFLEAAAQAPPGSAGLCFVPHLTGERCPTPDAFARAAWVGLTALHSRNHMCRAVIEGVTASMASILNLVSACGVGVHTLRVSGGGNRSQFWRQLQADMYRVPIVSTNQSEVGSALGAALLAGVGAGVWPTVQAACREFIKVTGVVEPRPDAPEVLQSLAARLAMVYEHIRPLGHALHDAETSHQQREIVTPG